ncbi:YbaK/EbsC family protein [Phaeacidiphilus oryzae]|jgi:prolyl-tRNA editing enzyme YbaK/EbsC (Cys-tRNA(Pro) deacylase)|uniref:YbaK/EbsC family protein n=1 Tax=Phaeacidiphilus oryzae TaxID=348818 RepID=UPI000560E8E8|nr:YbaK/EbsC family protein [Phaeacidiphilus oryzae]
MSTAATSSTPPFGRFDSWAPALERLDLLPDPVAEALRGWADRAAAESVLFVDTDPAKADTAAFAEAYGVPLDCGANCVVVAAKRGQETTLAGCLVRADTRLDVNKVVRKRLGARKASFAPMDTAVQETGMEYGGITPIGLPADWPLLVDEAVAETAHVLIGSGRRRGKLILPGAAVAQLPGVEVVSGLAAPVPAA